MDTENRGSSAGRRQRESPVDSERTIKDVSSVAGLESTQGQKDVWFRKKFTKK